MAGTAALAFTVGLWSTAAGAAPEQALATTPGVASSDDLPAPAEAGLRWTRAPSIRDVLRFHARSTLVYPDRGVAELACTPDRDGKVSCDILNEFPEDVGFGSAAQRVMLQTRVAGADGYSPEGRTFGYRVWFGRWPEAAPLLWINGELQWAERPALDWRMSGLDRNETATASFDCVARPDGSLDCDPTHASGDHPGLVDAGLEALEDGARVENVDGSALRETPFRWTFRITRRD